ncbi:MAG: hypothetical protein Q7J73_00290, partial [Dehalococcoidales bacterium]|nr:hypothetical protein [Dehalococcoidales bacterium]
HELGLMAHGVTTRILALTPRDIAKILVEHTLIIAKIVQQYEIGIAVVHGEVAGRMLIVKQEAIVLVAPVLTVPSLLTTIKIRDLL